MDEKLSQAINLFNAGQKKEALKLLTEILDKDPSNSHAWYGLALCSSDEKKKVEFLKLSLKYDPMNFKAKDLLTKIVGTPLDEEFNVDYDSYNLQHKRKMPNKYLTIPVIAVIVLITMLLVIFLPRFSPKGRYINDLDPIRNELEQWSADYDLFEWKANLTYTSDGMNIVERYNIILELVSAIGLSKSDFKPDDMKEYNRFGNFAAELASKGRSILDVLSLATPPEDFASAHDQVVKCLRFRIQILDDISYSISNLDKIDLSSGVNTNNYSDCFSYAASLEKIMSVFGGE